MFASPLRYYGDSIMRYRISGAGRQALCGLFVCSFRASCPSFFPLSFIILNPRRMRISTSWSSHWFSLLNQEFLHLESALPNPYSSEYPATTDTTDYTSTNRSFSGSSGFTMDDEEHTRRVNTLGHPLAQPVSIPASNGMRYNTLPPAIHDMP